MPHDDLGIRADELQKRYGATTALDGFDLTVPAGTVYGLLGPNGAGKTTAVRILSTLLRFDAGRAEVAGYDVVREPARLRPDRPHRPVRGGRRDPQRPAEPRPVRPPLPPVGRDGAAGGRTSCWTVRAGRGGATSRLGTTPAACGAGSTWPPA